MNYNQQIGVQPVPTGGFAVVKRLTKGSNAMKRVSMVYRFADAAQSVCKWLKERDAGYPKHQQDLWAMDSETMS